MKRFLLAMVAIAMACVTVMSQTSPNSKVSQTTGQVQKAPSFGSMEGPPNEFVIGPEDVLQINVWREPELTTKTSVRPDGKIGLPLLSDVQASGLTTRQLQERISTGLSRYIAEPQVTVIVTEVHSQLVHIIGAVVKPGMYPLGRPMTVVELLARAGGLVDFAKTKEIRVVRQENGSSRQFPFNYGDFAEGRNLQQNILLQNGDIVVVP